MSFIGQCIGDWVVFSEYCFLQKFSGKNMEESPVSNRSKVSCLLTLLQERLCWWLWCEATSSPCSPTRTTPRSQWRTRKKTKRQFKRKRKLSQYSSSLDAPDSQSWMFHRILCTYHCCVVPSALLEESFDFEGDNWCLQWNIKDIHKMYVRAQRNFSSGLNFRINFFAKFHWSFYIKMLVQWCA